MDSFDKETPLNLGIPILRQMHIEDYNYQSPMRGSFLWYMEKTFKKTWL